MRFLIFYFSVVFCISPLIHFSKTIHVGKNALNKSIQVALAQSQPYDTILVSPGVYHEKNLIIGKPLVLIGSNYPVLDGENKYEIVSIKSSHVTVRGFKLQHSGHGTLSDPAGIKLYNVHHVNVIDNVLNDTFFGIYLQYSKKSIIKNNRLTSFGKEEQQIGNGIHCWKSDSLLIEGNSITGHRDGIYFEFVTHSAIIRNNSHANIRYGLHFMFSHDDSYLMNKFIGNGAGVAVMFSHGVKMYYNEFNENWGDAAFGILLKEITDSHIEGNLFFKNTSGVYMEGVSRVVMKNNIFRNNGWAIKIQASCMDVNVNSNNFFGNTFDVGTNGTLVLNSFNKNYWDKYEGYDLNRDLIGDVPYHPVSMFSVIIEKNPPAMILYRSIMVSLLDKTEKLIPSLTPENLLDETPCMKPLQL